MEKNNIKYLCFGSPIMDIIVDTTKEQLNALNLELDRTQHVKKAECVAFNNLEESCEPEYLPGGCSYNTIRVFNWLVAQQTGNLGATAVLGALGNDKYGQVYEQVLESECIVQLIEKHDETGTGVCLVYCCERERGHLTDLGCSTMVTDDFVDKCFV